jgi:homospermidine synthase
MSLKDHISTLSDEDKESLSAFAYALAEGGADRFVTLKDPEIPNLSDEKDVKLVDKGAPGETEPQLPAKPSPVAAKTYDFTGSVVFFGFGGVAECTLPVLIRHLNLDFHKVTVIDMLDKSEVIKNWTDKGVTFVQRDIVKENFEVTISEFLKSGDLLIDVCYDIDCGTILVWCREHKILYVNTSVEEWDFFEGFDKRTPYDKSLYVRQQELDDEINKWPDNKGTTAILDMGANPGLISHFMKQGLLDLAKARKVSTKPTERNDYATLAKNIGVKVVLDTERDTQLSVRPKEVDEFVGTWSVLGLVEEATSPAELGWGTHEDVLPEHATIPDKGPKNQIFISQMGMHTLVRGFVPSDPKISPADGVRKVDGYEIIGTLIRHGEAYTISKFLTTKDGKYRPTVYYCYLPCDSTVASLREFASYNYCNENDRKPYHQRILYDNDILSGSDTLGVMIGGYDDDHVWWCGTSLNIEDARVLCPLQNATTIQVAIGLVAGICWMLENPNRGVCRPEDLDTAFVLAVAKPYLGTFISQEFEWSPARNFVNSYEERTDCEIDKKNLWAFRNFQFKPT